MTAFPARERHATVVSSEAAGIAVKSVHWTTGAHDLVLVTEGPEEAVMSLALQTAALGNIRTQTMRGYSASEMRTLASALKK